MNDQRRQLLDDLRRDVRVVLDTVDTACRRRFFDLAAEALIEERLKDMLKRLSEGTAITELERDVAKEAAIATRAESTARIVELEDECRQLAGQRDALQAKVDALAGLDEFAPPGHPLHSCGGPQEACMQPGCTECGCPTMEQALEAKAKLRHVCEIMATLGNPGLNDVLLEMHAYLFPEKAAVRAVASRQWAIIGPDGIVHYRRPEGHKDLDEARAVPSYKVVPVDSPEHAAAVELQRERAAADDAAYARDQERK